MWYTTKEGNIKERRCKRMKKNETEQKEGANKRREKNRIETRCECRKGRVNKRRKKQEEGANERKKPNRIKDGANEPTNKKETEQKRRCEYTKEANEIQRRWD